ncbi:MAG: response regulator [Nitrospinaceae bacterium]|jgi:CheY-like chemotaxis protein|nr:response regulator [Nitrospinaceae bacterium]MBT3435618.1 response regulator [Nitrospinaceae bacterium]MBT3819860.1 response regulator [Nitrospinaceae bacterium]MBT4092772.1 response regulator [Nitrospinaceae bacterium]MBT4431245.1 response regulator [Nitrospinaceae bacterium]
MATGDKTPSVIFAAREEFMIRIVRDLLRGCDIKTVGTNTVVKEAVADIRAHAKKWDIFLLDGNFDEAFDTVEEMRNEFGPHIKILLLMSTPTKEDVVRAHQVGVNDFVVLPCSQVDFEGKLYKLMGKEVAPKQQSKTAVVYRKV